MTTFRVIYTPTLMPKHRDFASLDDAKEYRRRMLRHDPEAEIVRLGGDGDSEGVVVDLTGSDWSAGTDGRKAGRTAQNGAHGIVVPRVVASEGGA